MGWFSPVKGSYPSLAQVDKTLQIDGISLTAVERGMIVALGSDTDGKPVWKMPVQNDKILYVALTDSTDPTAGFAGDAFDPKGGGTAAITAIDLAQDGEFESSVFVPGDYDIGDALYFDDYGKLTKTATNGTVVGYVTAVPASRWINNAVAVPPGGNVDRRLAYRTGAREKVIRFKTAL